MSPRRNKPPDSERLWTPAEFAAAMRVEPQTVTQWARDGLIPCIRTPSGRPRFRDSVVQAVLKGEESPGE